MNGVADKTIVTAGSGGGVPFSPLKRDRSCALDLIRAAAAGEVMVSHLAFFCFSFQAREPKDWGLIARSMAWAVSFGHQAVIIFFVLSGYLVGGSVMASRRNGFWSQYLVKRLARLWLVLLPCLALTAFWGLLSLRAGGADFMAGKISTRWEDAAPFHVPVKLDASTFFQNAFFLQEITASAYGTNGALWSLSFEFWYYILFPLLFWGLHFRSQEPLARRVIMAVLGGGLLIILPSPIRQGFFTWLLGAAVARLEISRWHRLFSRWQIGVPAIACFIFILQLSRYDDSLRFPGWSLACCLAVAMPWMMRLTMGTLGRVAVFFSEFSYTLYLAHTPFFAFIWISIFRLERPGPNPIAYVHFLCLAALVYIYAYGIYWIFERNTNVIRCGMASLLCRFLRRSSGPASVVPPE